MGFEWDSQDAIAVVVIDDKDIVVASARGCHKLASEVHVGLASGFHQGSKTKMSTFTIFVIGRWEGIIDVGHGVSCGG